MENSDAAIAATEVVSVSEIYWYKVRERLEQKSALGETAYKNHQDSVSTIFGNTKHLGMIGGVMMRRDLIGDTRFCTDLFIGEDFYFIYQNLIKGASSVLLKQKWYYSRIHENNISKNYSFSAFWTRFYRRELVWKSEEAFGRIEYANCQKVAAFKIFALCLSKNKLNSNDAKKMCKTLKEYKKDLFPAMSFFNKVSYYFYVYVPFTNHLTYKFKIPFDRHVKPKLRKILTKFRSGK